MDFRRLFFGLVALSCTQFENAAAQVSGYEAMCFDEYGFCAVNELSSVVAPPVSGSGASGQAAPMATPPAKPQLCIVGYFGAHFCGPCQVYQPKVSTLVASYPVKYTAYNFEDHPDVFERQRISFFPTVRVWKKKADGTTTMVYNHTGADDLTGLKAALDKHCKASPPPTPTPKPTTAPTPNPSATPGATPRPTASPR